MGFSLIVFHHSKLRLQYTRRTTDDCIYDTVCNSLNLMNHVDHKILENNALGGSLNGPSAAFSCILLRFSGTKWSHILFTCAFTDWQFKWMYFLKRKGGRGQRFPSSFSAWLLKPLSRPMADTSGHVRSGNVELMASGHVQHGSLGRSKERVQQSC